MIERSTILRAHDVAVVLADSAGKFPMVDAITSDFAYVRLHGADELYVSGYSDEKLDSWAAKVNGFVADGLDTFVYFDNDAKVHAPYNAMSLLNASSARALTGLRALDSDERRERRRRQWSDGCVAGRFEAGSDLDQGRLAATEPQKLTATGRPCASATGTVSSG